MDTEVNRFLIEFHRRQRAQLLVPATPWARLKEWLSGFELAPSLSYASAFAAIALTAFVGLSRQVEVTHSADGQYKFSLHSSSSDSSFAMLPTSLGTTSVVSPKTTDGMNFGSASSDSATTRYVLANSHVAYDANVAF